MRLHAIKRFPDMAAVYELRTDPTIGATATDTYLPLPGYGADKAVDGSLATRWATNDGVLTATLSMNLGQLRQVSQLHIAEEYDRVRGFTVLRARTHPDGSQTWEPVATGTTIGPYRRVSFPAVATMALRLEITAATEGPTIAEVWVR